LQFIPEIFLPPALDIAHPSCYIIGTSGTNNREFLIMKKVLAVFALAALLGGCSKVENQTVPVSADRPLTEVVEEAAKADAKQVKIMIASYEAAIKECQRKMTVAEKDVMKEKVVEINGETVKALQSAKDDIAKESEKLSAALKVYQKRLSELAE